MSREIDLSVVVAASWSAEAAARTVASIGTTDGVEVIVASDPHRVVPGPLPGGARWIVGERGDGVPRLRRVGACAAVGRVVAFVEDACVIGPEWVDAVREAFADGDCPAATGPVVQGDGASATDWAVYFAEYAPFAGPVGPSGSLPSEGLADRHSPGGPPPGPLTHKGGGDQRRPPHPHALPRGERGPEGPVPENDGPSAHEGGRFGWGMAGARPTQLAGINFALRREVLAPSPTIRESELSSRLAGSIRRLEGATVHHTRRYAFAEAFADRWRFGREFGRERWADHPGRLRWLGVVAAPAILGVQLGRLAHSVLRNRPLGKSALISSPRTLALLMAWSAGEALGWAEACRVGSPRRGREAPRPASGPGPAPNGPAGCKAPPAVA